MTKLKWMLLKALKISEGDLPQLMMLWTLYALLSCSVEVAKLIAEVLFLSRAGIKWLPSLFVGQALVSTLAAVGYVAIVKRWSTSRVFAGLLTGFGVMMIACGLGATRVQGTVAYGLVFIFAEGGATLLKIHWGVYILDIYNPGSASRLFPFLFTGAALGRSAGGAAVKQGAAFIGLPYLLAGMIVLTIPFSLYLLFYGKNVRRKQMKKNFSVTKKPLINDKKPQSKYTICENEEDSDLICKKTELSPPTAKKKHIAEECENEEAFPAADLFAKNPDAEMENISPGDIFQLGANRKVGSTMKSIITSPLVKAMVVSTGLMVMLRHLMRYGSLVILQANYEETALASVVGTYSLIANPASIGLQLLFAPRFLKKFGVEAASLLYAGSITLGLGLLACFVNVPSALAARFFHTEFKGAVRTPISPIFYFGEPRERRAEVRALILGGAAPLFTVAGGLLLQAVSNLASITFLAFCGTLLGAGYIAACEWQNRIYRRQLKLLGMNKA